MSVYWLRVRANTFWLLSIFLSPSLVCSGFAPGSVLSNRSGGSWMMVASALVMWTVSPRRPHPPRCLVALSGPSSHAHDVYSLYTTEKGQSRKSRACAWGNRGVQSSLSTRSRSGSTGRSAWGTELVPARNLVRFPGHLSALVSGTAV